MAREMNEHLGTHPGMSSSSGEEDDLITIYLTYYFYFFFIVTDKQSPSHWPTCSLQYVEFSPYVTSKKNIFCEMTVYYNSLVFRKTNRFLDTAYTLV